MTDRRHNPWPPFRQTDSREMCFSQGKAFVYMPSDDHSRVITEWPNGIIEEYVIADESITRKWPDGRVQHFRNADAAAKERPYTRPAVA